MKKIIIAGGTGFLGRCLSKFYSERNYEVYILSRGNHLDQAHLHFLKWDGKTLGNWSDALENAEALINLTGKSVDCRYNEGNKKAIYSSRLDATHVLGSAVSKCKNPPRVWINAASATIYRHSLDKPMDEKSGEIGTGFSVDVCQKWEKSFNLQHTPHTRKLILRTSIVLGREGGAFPPLKRLAQLGMGGKQGPGNQYFSWIHVQDFVNIVDFAIQNERMEGTYNLASPHPVRNVELMKQLRIGLRMPFGFDMPTWLLQLGAVLIQTETELILKSRFVIPQRLMQKGYSFRFSQIDEALEDLLKKK